PFAGTGTTAVVAQQLHRCSVSIERDPRNVSCIRWRLQALREADSIAPLKHYYRFTPHLESIWGEPVAESESAALPLQFCLFEESDSYGRL
ncbi:MAG: site-specific DNA-methyltransferase, partial [Fimbriimonadales bacterium]